MKTAGIGPVGVPRRLRIFANQTSHNRTQVTLNGKRMVTKKSVSNTLVPFTREKTRHITVTALLGGKRARFLVDTGAGATCVHAEMLAKFGLSLSTYSRRGGGVGTSTMRMTTIQRHDLSLEGVDLSQLKLVALDLSHVNAGFAKAKVSPIAGVLGADVFLRHRAVIDYSRSFIILSRTGART